LVVELFVKHVAQLCEDFFRAGNALKMGQFLWWAPAVNQKRAGKRMEDTQLVPVVLTLITPEELQQLAAGGSTRQLRPQVLARLLKEAHAQGGVLSASDLASFWCQAPGTVCGLIRQYEREQDELLPTAGAIFDLGCKTTHKRQIVQEHLKKKLTPEIAAKFSHSAASTDRYLRDFARIKLCFQRGMTVQEAAQATGISLRVAKEYEALTQEHFPELFAQPGQVDANPPAPPIPLERTDSQESIAPS
jgi:predicted DNA-binding protein (UPF0251 family)